MERRYLVAALAIIATFAVTSRSFRALENLSQARNPGAMAEPNCGSNSAVARAMANVRCRVLAKIRTHLHLRSPDEAQWLAEMQLPAIGTDAEMAARTARQDAAAAQCARTQALREADRARRDAMRIQQEVTRSLQAGPGPTSFGINLPPGLDQQIQAQMARAASQRAASNVKLQIAADQLRANASRLGNLKLPAIDVRVMPSGSLHRRIPCGVAQAQ